MNRIVCLVILSLGTVLTIFSLNVLDYVGAAFARLFAGSFADWTLWLLIAGVLLFIGGLIGLITSPTPSSTHIYRVRERTRRTTRKDRRG